MKILKTILLLSMTSLPLTPFLIEPKFAVVGKLNLELSRISKIKFQTNVDGNFDLKSGLLKINLEQDNLSNIKNLLTYSYDVKHNPSNGVYQIKSTAKVGTCTIKLDLKNETLSFLDNSNKALINKTFENLKVSQRFDKKFENIVTISEAILSDCGIVNEIPEKFSDIVDSNFVIDGKVNIMSNNKVLHNIDIDGKLEANKGYLKINNFKYNYTFEDTINSKTLENKESLYIWLNYDGDKLEYNEHKHAFIFNGYEFELEGEGWENYIKLFNVGFQINKDGKLHIKGRFYNYNYNDGTIEINEKEYKVADISLETIIELIEGETNA